MSDHIAFNRITKKWNSYSVAVKNGLLTHPERFSIAADVYIRKDTKNHPVLTKKRAEKLLRNGTISPFDLIFNTKENVYNPNSGIFNDNTKRNIKKIDSYIQQNPKSHKDKKLKSYTLREYGIDYPIGSSVDVMTLTPKQLDDIKRKIRNIWFYISTYKNLPPNTKFSIKLYGGSHNWLSVPFSNDIEASINEIVKKLTDIPNKYNTGFQMANVPMVISVKSVIIGVVMPNGNMAGVSTNFEILGNNDYRVISPKSITNCLYHAWTLCEEPQNLTQYVNNNRSLEQKARKLKQRLNPTLKGLSDMGTVQELCDYKHRSAIIYDSVFNVKATIQPKVDKKQPPIKLQFVNNHMLACIPWSSFTDRKIQSRTDTIKVDSKKRDANKKIIKHFSQKDYDDRIIVWDIEASRDECGNFKAYAVGVAWEENGEQKIQIWFGLDCLIQFLDFLNDNFEKFDGWTLYAHNGGKFDIPVLLREGLLLYENFTIDVSKIVELNKSFIGFGLKKGDLSIKMKDSLRLLPQKLADLTKDFKVPHQKLTETIKHEDITLANYNSEAYYSKLHSYLTNDCLGLLEVLHKFSKSVYASTGINIQECYTGASLSKKNYFKNYYNQHKTPIYTLSDQMDQYIRKGYGGGRCEAFRINTKIEGKIYYFDFTSLYPATGCMRLPYGEPMAMTEIKPNTLLTASMISNHIGFYNVMVKTIDFSKKPIHGMKDETGRYIFPHFNNWTQLDAVFTQEIRLGLIKGIYEYKFLDGYTFDAKPILKDFFTDAFNKKAEAKKAGDDAMALCYKIIANSGYGFWGLRTEGRDGIRVFYDDDGGVIPLIKANKLLDLATYGKYTFARAFDDIGVKDFNVGIASAITSYARMQLWSAINDIESKGGEVYYCDTDSIITNLNISEYPDIMKTYMWDGTGEALGALKNEIEEKVSKHFTKLKFKEIKKQHYANITMTKEIEDEIQGKAKAAGKLLTKQQEASDGGFINFEELIIGGCKFYSCKKTLINGDVIEINKLKGYKQVDNEEDGELDELSFEIFEDLISGKIPLIKQTQNQFICPKSNYVSEEHKFGISIKPVVKEFNITYNKGTVEGSYIKPLIL